MHGIILESREHPGCLGCVSRCICGKAMKGKHRVKSKMERARSLHFELKRSGSLHQMGELDIFKGKEDFFGGGAAIGSKVFPDESASSSEGSKASLARPPSMRRLASFTFQDTALIAVHHDRAMENLQQHGETWSEREAQLKARSKLSRTRLVRRLKRASKQRKTRDHGIPDDEAVFSQANSKFVGFREVRALVKKAGISVSRDEVIMAARRACNIADKDSPATARFDKQMFCCLMKDLRREQSSQKQVPQASTKIDPTSKKSMKKIRMLYRKIDTDSSGSVSAEEFLLGFESAGATEQNVQEAISSACNVSIDEALDLEMNIDQFQKAYVNLMSLVSAQGDNGEQQQRHLGRVSDNVSNLFDTLQLNGAVSVEASIRHVLRVMRFDATEDDLCLVAAEVLGADESKVLSKKFCKGRI